MRADIHDGQGHKRSMQGPDTEAQDHPPFVQIRLATHGRSIQTCQERTHEPEQAAALQLSFALSWSQALRFEHESCGRAFQEQDERLRSLGCLAVGADSRGEFRHLCELSWQWPH